MAFKVNYGFQKAERDRLKREKKEAKARERAAKGGGPDDVAPQGAHHGVAGDAPDDATEGGPESVATSDAAPGAKPGPAGEG